MIDLLSLKLIYQDISVLPPLNILNSKYLLFCHLNKTFTVQLVHLRQLRTHCPQVASN